MSNMSHLIGQRVAPKEAIPSDKRGRVIEAGTVLFVKSIVGPKHVSLAWADGKLAASQVFIEKLRTA